jgi:nucleotide-binding universal stress UspA family protein
LKINFPNWTVTADSTCGSAAWELISKADHWDPDLIVVGSHGRNAFSRFVLGSVSQRVLTEARCSVRISRGRVDEPENAVRILIATDGSPASLEGVRQVATRQWPNHSEIKVIVVDDPVVPAYVGNLIPPLGKILEEDRQQERDWVKRIAELPLAILSEAGIKAISEIREGDPKIELARAAEEWGADCIFVGSCGFSNRFERFVLGSVSAAVAARAHCSVEVVRSKSNRDS